MRLLCCLLLCCAGLAAQDVFVGGRVDVEASLSDRLRFELGRQAGLDLTFSQPRLLDAYADLSLAGGEVRLQELYLQLPQTRKVVDVTLGRFLLPHGDRGTQFLDRYAAGARDFFSSYDGWRRGACLIDTDADGIGLSREFTLARGASLLANLYGVQTPGEHLAYGARLGFDLRGLRLGASWFDGHDRPGAKAHQAVLSGGWRGAGVDVLGQYFVGRASGGDHHGYQARLAYQWPTTSRLPLDLFVARTAYFESGQDGVASTRAGLGYRFGRYYRAELRYELNDAPGASGDDALTARLLAVF